MCEGSRSSFTFRTSLCFYFWAGGHLISICAQNQQKLQEIITCYHFIYRLPFHFEDSGPRFCAQGSKSEVLSVRKEVLSVSPFSKLLQRKPALFLHHWEQGARMGSCPFVISAVITTILVTSWHHCTNDNEEIEILLTMNPTEHTGWVLNC